MVSYKIWSGDRAVLVNIYTTKWRMHSASLIYKRTWNLDNSTHGTLGTCYRWWLDPDKKNKIVSLILMSWDTLTIDVLSHELLHAAVHIWTYDKEDEGKLLSTKNDEELAYIHSNLFEDILSLFTENDMKKLIKNHNV